MSERVKIMFLVFATASVISTACVLMTWIDAPRALERDRLKAEILKACVAAAKFNCSG